MRDHVHPSHICGIAPNLRGNKVHHPLHGETRFWAAGASVGRIGNLVGGGDPRADGKVVELVRTGQMHCGVVGDAGSDRVPGSAIGDEAVPECQQSSFVVEADLDVVNLVARVTGTHEMLVPVLDPSNRPADGTSEKRNQQVLGIDMSLDAKSATHIKCDAANTRLREVEDRGGFSTEPMYDLRR